MPRPDRVAGRGGLCGVGAQETQGCGTVRACGERSGLAWREPLRGHPAERITLRGAPQDDADVRLRAAVGGYDEVYTRSRMMAVERLATLIFTNGDPREAASIGHQAVDDAQRLRSGRVADRLRQLRQVTTQHTAIPEARELGERITQLAGVA
jgi:hypothetical protein